MLSWAGKFLITLKTALVCFWLWFLLALDFNVVLKSAGSLPAPRFLCFLRLKTSVQLWIWYDASANWMRREIERVICSTESAKTRQCNNEDRPRRTDCCLMISRCWHLMCFMSFYLLATSSAIRLDASMINATRFYHPKSPLSALFQLNIVNHTAVAGLKLVLKWKHALMNWNRMCNNNQWGERKLLCSCSFTQQETQWMANAVWLNAADLMRRNLGEAWWITRIKFYCRTSCRKVPLRCS